MNIFIFVVLLFVLAALLRLDFFFTIFYLFGGVFILSRLWAGQTFKRLSVTRKMPSRAFPGEKITVTLTLKNRSSLPIPWLTVHETLPLNLAWPTYYQEATFLGSKTSQDFKYLLTTQRRGFYLVGPLLLETGDLLGFIPRVNNRLEATHLIVYPKVVPITRLNLPTHSPQVVLTTQTPLFQDPSRLTGVREYVPGDNPRHIHWPATATTGQVLVKQFQPAIARDSVIFLDLTRPNYSRRPVQANAATELAIVVAASLANHIINVEQLSVGLNTTGKDPLSNGRQDFQLPSHRGGDHLMQILEVLARIQNIETGQFEATLRAATAHLAWGTTIIVISGSESDELLETLLLLKQAGFPVSLVLVQPAPYAYVQPKKAQALGFTVYRIRYEEDIETWTPLI